MWADICSHRVTQHVGSLCYKQTCKLLEYQDRLQDFKLILVSTWQVLEIEKARVNLLHDLCLSFKWEFKIKGKGIACIAESFYVSLLLFTKYLWNMPSPKNTLCCIASVQPQMRCLQITTVSYPWKTFINPGLVIGPVFCELTLRKMAVRYSCYPVFVLLLTSADTCPVKYFNYFIIVLWVKWKKNHILVIFSSRDFVFTFRLIQKLA